MSKGKEGRERKGKGDGRGEEVEEGILPTQNFGVAPPMVSLTVVRYKTMLVLMLEIHSDTSGKYMSVLTLCVAYSG